MVKVAILIPVLRRPQNIKPLAESVETNTSDYELFFIASPGDEKEIEELDRQNQYFGIMKDSYENNGDYARKINAGFGEIKAEWYFLGADDIRFHTNWFESAMVTYEKTQACVIGTNDLGSPVVINGSHSTHSLVLGEYVTECGTIDEPGKILHEGYPHEYVDTEFVETAKCRLAWAFSKNSVVEHLHPNWGKGTTDSLYAAQPKRMQKGKLLYERRKKLWN